MKPDTSTDDTAAQQGLGLFELIAMVVGGMIGGGIFSVLGLAVSIAGHGAPLAFGIGSLIALAAGYSYVRLALTYHSDGASFTYLERAFPKQPSVSGVAGWTVIGGYVGTLALYAFHQSHGPSPAWAPTHTSPSALERGATARKTRHGTGNAHLGQSLPVPDAVGRLRRAARSRPNRNRQ